MFKKIAAAAALAIVASSSFAAAPTAFYGGLDVGATKADDYDSTKTSFGGFVGYGFNQFFAVEAGYRQLGKYDFDVFVNNQFVNANVKAKQTHLSVIGSYPLNAQLDLYGRLGYNRLEAEARVAGFSAKEHDSHALYGLGLGYTFTPVVHGRVEVQKPESDVTRVLAGVAFRF